MRNKNRKAVQDHKNARADLEKTARKSRDETTEFLEANRKAVEAEQKVSWIRR